MRSLVYFFPPRTSVTASVGIRTRPIFSCTPNACTRDSSDSFTLRSKPEYEWMMYHFMFGFLAFSIPGATSWGNAESAAPSAPWPPAPISFFSSSCMLLTAFNRLTFLTMGEVAQHLVDAASDHKINHVKIQAEQEYSDHHHRRRRLHFLHRRRRHLLHLGAHIEVKALDPLWPRLDLRQPLVATDLHCC